MLYGLHPNAEIGFLTTTSETLFKTVFELQPRESGSSGGPVTTREDKIKALVDDVMEKLPEAFNMGEIMGKVEERTPYVVVAFQVCKETKDCSTSLRSRYIQKLLLYLLRNEVEQSLSPFSVDKKTL